MIPILATKLYIPQARPTLIRRTRLIERMNEGLSRNMTLVAAPAGFGKTTLASEWSTQSTLPVAWLSLDAADNDPTRFLSYLVAALQTIAPALGAGVLGALQAPQTPPIEALLTILLNEMTTLPERCVLLLDDYHVLDDQVVNQAIAFLLEHQPPQLHWVIVTREDPQLPLARMRVRGQLTELRVNDLRFTPAEAAEFLTHAMGLELSPDNLTALETRTEGWIAGLHLAALSLQSQSDPSAFIGSFTGSHRFVLDYLAEEVLLQQPESVQAFLFHTAILDRLCGPLCEAVFGGAPASGQATLEYLEHANLFIIPLDNERRWYRYHHLFGDLLRQRLTQHSGALVVTLHQRASEWYERNGFELEAFHHAVAADDRDRATRLVEGNGMPLPFRGAAIPVLNWLKSLPPAALDDRPVLWVMYASVLLFTNQVTGVEQKLQAAEVALRDRELDAKTRDLVGHIALIRATLAVTQHQTATIIAQSQRALAYLHPNNLPVRTATNWTLGYAYQLQGDRGAARRAYSEAIAISRSIGHQIITILATIGLGNLQESELQLAQAAETYRHVLQLIGNAPLAIACEAHLGLARIFYQWNDLDSAHTHGQLSLTLARQFENTDRWIACEVFLARLKLAQGAVDEALIQLAHAEQFALQHAFTEQIFEIMTLRIAILIDQGAYAEAMQLAESAALPISQARVHLSAGNPTAALMLVEPALRQAEAHGWIDQRLALLILQAIILEASGDKFKALQALREALLLGSPSGCIRSFVDAGPRMTSLLVEAIASGMMPEYLSRLLAVYQPQQPLSHDRNLPQPLIEPLSQREIEILQLIAQGLSNQEIGDRLFLALSTVKGHIRNIFDKLHVQRRTKAVARARELGLL